MLQAEKALLLAMLEAAQMALLIAVKVAVELVKVATGVHTLATVVQA
jgi:hypothetical protein